ncbi:hypothetical protein N7539_006532 [Penicillium diatomitis]|uniref:N-acetyltransferase domain-containing protein n=1 Tax=Penicillium diatomitis TaxID=2819901 RepID=A0A9X0BT49_9EURO|nr:uncharacterized protein N7539_006532 [Penicillium diatomitis]KAJ5483086.1 hypothetical protein N7539_006532 [Penicillium diatomitis]
MCRPLPKGGIAIRTLPVFLGKLNRAVGLGSQGTLSEDELREFESMYLETGLDMEVHLSPFATSMTLESLIARGYEERVMLSTYHGFVDKLLDGSATTSTFDKVTIRQIQQPLSTHEREQFIESSIAGFQTNGRPRELLGTLARIATERTDTALFVTRIDDQIAGSAAMAKIESYKGDEAVAYLYLDSTLPEYRGRGVQQAVIQARIHAAQFEGLSLLTTTTTVNDGSARNAERAGLIAAYTAPVLIRPASIQPGVIPLPSVAESASSVRTREK